MILFVDSHISRKILTQLKFI